MLKQIKALKTKKGRDKLNQFIVEGEKFINEIPDNWNIRYYACARRYADSKDLRQFKMRAHCELMDDHVFDSLSDTITPQGVLAVCEQKHFHLADVVKNNCFLFLGEGLSDPGNIGTLIRTAAAAGAGGFILTHGSAELYSPKIVRSSAGAIFLLPIITGLQLDEIMPNLRNHGFNIYAASLKGELLPYNVDFLSNFCLMVGNEAHGLTQQAVNEADGLIKVPMTGCIDSLNASIAGSILMYEAVRQRTMTRNV